ncbi:MAG: VWA domain-containing protein [Deltaproteobacteria bacterium]|nr:VWA domain-containing protein [Deltaproteobacteria bacterium]
MARGGVAESVLLYLKSLAAVVLRKMKTIAIKRNALLLLFCVFLVLRASCTDAEIEPLARPPLVRDDKFGAEGNFCTTSPESIVFPLRVLFVVDSSESILVTDPGDPVSGETGRERAVSETWRKVLEGGPEGVRVGILRFSAEAHSETPEDLDTPPDGLPDSYYTTDTGLLQAGTAGLRVTDRTTNYLNAISEAYFELRTELKTADSESLPLSKYLVIFLSDGLPDVDSHEALQNTEENILDAVKQLKDLAARYHVGVFQFHTAYLSSDKGLAYDKSAQQLLQRMAEMGDGTFRSFPSGESLNFLHIDVSAARRVFTLKGMSAVNQNAVVDRNQILDYLFPADAGADGDASDGADQANRPDAAASTPEDAGIEDADVEPDAVDLRLFVDIDGDELPGCAEPLVDSDGDGVADITERRIGTDPLVPDTDDDGLNDRLEWRMQTTGFDARDPSDAKCFIPDPCVDQNQDGFCDCLRDVDMNGQCDCVVDDEQPCHDDLGHDCVDEDGDGLCDCPDADRDERCDYDDRDQDGLNDCEEIFIGSAKNGYDTDADGLPDWLEQHAQSNPVSDDRLQDLDWDQTLNGEEVLAGTDPWCNESATRSLGSYRYVVEKLHDDQGTTCYSFKIGNITLVPSATNPNADFPGNGWNRILFFIAEVSFDDPGAFPIYRVACVMVRYEPDGNYRNPPSGRVSLREKDFVSAGAFNATKDCIWPKAR